MKSFPTIISKLSEPLLITPTKHAALWRVVEAHLSGSIPVRIQDDEDGGGSDDGGDYRQIGDKAIIPVHGVIGRHLEKMASASPGCDLDLLDAMIDTAEYDKSVKTVIYDFRTPGGDANGVPETAAKILRSSKDTVGFFDQECCSGGAWLAAQCQRLYGTGSGRFGSIGAYCVILDRSRAIQNEGINVQAISAGKFKLMGAPWKPLTEEEKQIIQTHINKLDARFHVAMNAVRACSDENMGTGLCFDGEEAAARGLIDGVADDLDEVLEFLSEE